MGNAQFFETDNSSDDQEEPNNGAILQENTDYEQPDQGLDDTGPGNPGGPVPVNDWMYLLPAIGIGIGAYFLSRKRNLA